MNDNELFELCKSVYEKTEWDNTLAGAKERFVNTSPDNVETLCLADVKSNGLNKEIWFKATPLYTSDYLLEKLPKSLQDGDDTFYLGLGYVPISFIPVASYANSSVDRVYYDPKHICRADTPLKTLLKLTLVLHESGDLK